MVRDKSGRFSKAKKIATPTQLSAIECDVIEILNHLRALRSEIGERLHFMELKLEQLQNPPTLTGWTKAQREAFLSGLRSV
jgi:hypothetical protein